MAVARRLPQRVEPSIFTTSVALSVVRRQGFLAEYFPPRGLTEGEEGRRRWDVTVAPRLGGLLEDYAPPPRLRWHHPYPGLHAIWRSGRPRFVWSRPGMWQAGKGEASLRSAWAFDHITRRLAPPRPPPGRRAKITGVPPVLFADPDELLEKEAAIRELGGRIRANQGPGPARRWEYHDPARRQESASPPASRPASAARRRSIADLGASNGFPGRRSRQRLPRQQALPRFRFRH